MDYLEVEPVPEECTGCGEDDCYLCDISGRRWGLSEADTLCARRKMKLRAIQRLQREIAAIDRELAQIKGNTGSE